MKVERINYLADRLLFAGVVLALASATPQSSEKISAERPFMAMKLPFQLAKLAAPIRDCYLPIYGNI